MSAPTLSPLLTAAVQDRTSGATGVARQVLDGLLELVDDRHLLHEVSEALPGMLPGYASMWHISRASHDVDPGRALRVIRAQLDHDVERSVSTAIELLRERGGVVRTAPSSSLVKAVTAALVGQPVDPDATTGGVPDSGTGEVAGGAAGSVGAGVAAGRVTGLAGADAISPSTVLNIRGTLELARRVPTIVVTTSLKLVPESVFQRLGSPAFEPIPLELFEAIVLDGEVLTPAEAGRRAASIG